MNLLSQLNKSDLNILLVEPSSMQQTVISKKLNEEGVSDIVYAKGKLEALTRISKYPPDLIISNLHYEDGTAIELLHQLRKHEKFSGLPFILISSEQRRDQLEIFKQSGILAILTKPFEQETLQRALKSTLAFINQSELYLENYDVNTLRVVLVDDSKLARKAISRVLSNLGLNNITEFDDGCYAIDYLKTAEVDLVVTDYNMPKINGIELTQYMRKSAEHAHVPVLMVTSEAKDSHLEKVREAGVNAILDKPFDTTNIKSILFKMFQD
ncbi:MAG: chemotaxis protein CheY/response regulator receiver domain protein [Osedax symbiont Rs2]|nr:MAG: chemotaxis protein CheY/response regulator receiver domain protein [Osedax symbiont Rs2]